MADNADLSLTGQADPSNKDYYLVKISKLKTDLAYTAKFQWSFQDQALNDKVQSLWSNGYQFRTIKLPTLLPPKFLNTDLSYFNGILIITWNGLDAGGNPYTKSFDRINVYVKDETVIGGVYRLVGSLKAAGTIRVAVPPRAHSVKLTVVDAEGVESDFSIAQFETPKLTPSTLPTSASGSWVGTNFKVSFTHNAAEEFFSLYKIKLIAGGVSKIFDVPATPGTTSQSFTLSLSQNRAVFGVPQTAISGSISVVNIYGNESAEVPFSTATYVNTLPAAIIVATAISNGYSVSYTIPTDSTFNTIEIEEVESASATAPPTGYGKVFSGSSSPAIIPAGDATKRWVRARFTDNLGSYGPYGPAVAVTPIDLIAAALDITPPTAATSISATWSGNNLSITATVSADAKKFIIRLTNGNTVGFFTKFPAVAGTSQTILLTEQELYNTLGSYFTSFSGLFVSADALDNRDAGAAFTVAQKTNPLLGVVPTFTLTAITNGYTATWVLPSGAAYAKVYERATSWGGGNPIGGELVFSGQSPAIIKKTVYTTRYVKIEYLSTDGFTSSFSAEQTVTPIDAIAADVNAPNAPGSITATAGTDNTGTVGFNGFVNLTWAAVSDSTLRGYRIRFRPYKASAPFENYSHVDSPGTGTSYRLGSLALGTVYEIGIASYDEFNNTSSAYTALSPNITVNGSPFIGTNVSTTGYFEAGVSGTDTGTFKFGYGVDTGKRGLVLNGSNYWYIDSAQSALFKIGGSANNFVYWNGQKLEIDGDLGVAGGTTIGGNIAMGASGASIFQGTLTSGNLSSDGFLLNSGGLVIKKGAVQLRLDTSDGGIYAERGLVAGWTIDSSKIERLTSSKYSGISSSGDYSFYAGATASGNSAGDTGAAFWVKPDGTAKATGITITGGSLTVGASSIAATTGKLISTDAEITGKITASTGKIGNLNIDSGGLYIGANPLVSSVTLNSAGIAAYNAQGAKLFGLDTSGYLFSDSASIGKWNVDATSISKTSNNGTLTLNSATAQITATSSTYTAGIATPDSNNPADIVFWAGGSRSISAPFYVRADGGVVMTSATITGYASPDDILLLAKKDMTNVTSISGGKITTGVIKSGNFVTNTNALLLPYSASGTSIDLDTGAIVSTKFYLGSDGTASFKGTLSAGVSIDTPTITSGSITGATITVTDSITSSGIVLVNDSGLGDTDTGGGNDVSSGAGTYTNTVLTLANGKISSSSILQISGASYTEILSGGTQSAMFDASKSSLTFSTGLYLGNPSTSSSSSMQSHASPYISIDARMRLRRGAPLTYPGGSTGAYVRNIYIKSALTTYTPSPTTGYVGDIMITY